MAWNRQLYRLIQILLSILFIYSQQALAANESNLLIGKIPYIDSKIELDGRLAEQAWRKALKIDIDIETEPAENQASKYLTNAYIYKDSNTLYVGFKAFDPEPNSIRAFSSDRDDIWRSDLVSIKLDTFNDSRRAFAFYSTPTGIQGDVMLDDTINASDIAWDAIWQSQGQITGDGYEVEMQIPLKALRFESGSSDATWGIELLRVVRKDVMYRNSSQPKKRGSDCSVCGLRNIAIDLSEDRGGHVTLIPAVVALNNQERDIEPLSAWEEGQNETSASLDLRWGISEQSILNATINPDFSQVEADAFQLDVNTLSVLSLVEKRPFFTDGKAFFSNWSQIIYTRIFEKPDYGVKYTTKNNNHSLGLMALNDSHTNFVIPYSQGAYFESRDTESNNLAARYRYDLGARSNVGLTLTHRNADDYENSVVGIDGKYWVTDKDYFKFQSFWSDTQNPDSLVNEFQGIEDDGLPLVAKNMTGNTFAVNYTHNGRDWRWYGTYHRFDNGFRADSGFIGVSNWERSRYALSRYWFSSQEESWWKSASIFTAYQKVNRVSGGELSQQNSLNFELNGIFESSIGLDLTDESENFDNYEFSRDARTLWGELTLWSNVDIKFEQTDSDDILYSTATAGRSMTHDLEIKTHFTEDIKLELEFINQIFEIENQRYYDFSLINFKLAYQINELSFLRLTLQNRSFDLKQDDYSNDKNRGIQLLYSYKLNPFTLFYLGYSDAAQNTIQNKSPIVFDRSLFLKLSYAWQQ